MNEIGSGVEHERDTEGRFTHGASGNPAGRPPGIMDKRVALRKQLLDPLLPETIEQLRKAVVDGQKWAIVEVLRFCLPKPKPVDPEELDEFELRLAELEEAARQ